MGNEGAELKVSYEKLQRLIELESNKSVGEILKRFDIIIGTKIRDDEDPKVVKALVEDRLEFLKKIVKELIYERYRDLRDLFVTVGMGLPLPKKWSVHQERK